MHSKRADTKRWITEDDVNDWPSANVLALGGAVASDYERKVSAVKQYVAGASLKSIFASTRISRQHLYYLIERCQLPDADGRPIGFCALIKDRYVTSRRRSDPSKLTAGRALPGALQGLFARYPQLEKWMTDLIIHGRMPESKRTNRRLTWAQIQEVFEGQCLFIGIQPPNYPFSSNSKGGVALRRWGRKLRSEQKRLTDHAVLLSLSQASSAPPPSRCYGRVECDGHYVDLNWTIEVPGLKGEGVVFIKVTRLWLIALIETKSSAVIGYSVSLNRSNYSTADIARAIRSSLVPWTPRQLSISSITYRPGECLPNALDPRLSYVCYDELWLDNAKSHLSDLFLSVLERTVNAVPVIGPRKAPNVRPNIEMLFDLIEEAGIHPLDGTTGSHHDDPRKSDKRDDRYLLTLDVVLDLIDLLIVRYNTGIAPGTSISRLEVLKRAVEREVALFRRLPARRREECLNYDLFEIARIGQERGRPILRWRDARYFGPSLLSMANLVGQEVLVMASSLDLRNISVSLTANGTSLGVLDVELRWRSTPHTLWTRASVRKEMSNSSFLRHAADIPRAMRAHAEMEAKNNLHAKRQLAQLVAEQDILNRPLANTEGNNGKLRSENNKPDDVEENVDIETARLIKKLGSVYR